MFIYANGFHVSVKDDQSEVLIRFVQNSPAYGGMPLVQVRQLAWNRKLYLPS